MEEIYRVKPKDHVLLFTGGDPWGTPSGGQTTFAKHLLTAFGPKIAVSSYCTDRSIPTGKWIQRPFNGKTIWYFSRGHHRKYNSIRPLIPLRVKAFFNAKRFLRDITKMQFAAAFIDSPEILFAVRMDSFERLCYRFAGVNNPVSNSRYIWFRFLGRIFEKYHISVLKRLKPEAILASADLKSINEFHKRTGHQLDKLHFHQFPTRVDTDLFFPIEKMKARRQLNLPTDAKILMTVGRLSWIKGWDLILSSFAEIIKILPDAVLIFVGEGEDRNKLDDMASTLNIRENIMITGSKPQKEVAMLINACDVCLVASYREGWSLAMCEMIACGKPIVSTDVSGARDMIQSEHNGFIVAERNSSDFAATVLRALNLRHAPEISLEIAKRYSVKNLARDLGAVWEPLNLS